VGAAPLNPTPLTSEPLGAARAWFRAHARVFPWTATHDPYAIWISEIMLQQTVVSAGIAPYERWMARWPDLPSLAAADESDVLAAWEGLGYASRARNLHRAARQVVAGGGTTLPSTYDQLRELPGIGDYTASALLAFAFGQPALTLDANLKRIFQRLGATHRWTKEAEAAWRASWAALVEGPSSREANQALMQLGQLVCTSRKPSCEVCPLSFVCVANRRGLQAEIPEPVVRTTTELQTNVAVVRRGAGVGLQFWLARPLTGRFSTLWLFPPLGSVEVRGLVPVGPLTARVHTYTRYKDLLSPTLFQLPGAAAPTLPTSGPLPAGWAGQWMTPAEAKLVGLVSVYRKILDEALSLT